MITFDTLMQFFIFDCGDNFVVVWIKKEKEREGQAEVEIEENRNGRKQ